MPEPTNKRYLPLDAMRGLVMIVLVSNGFGFRALLDDPIYGSIARQFHHPPWEGLVFWELIMPAFMFMMGTALPFALARRRQRGVRFSQDLRHTARRLLTLVLLGQFLTTLNRGHYAYEPYENLTMLAASYFCAYLIFHLGFRWQVVAAAGLMFTNWGLYHLFPGADGPYSPAGNIGVVIDRVVFGLDHAGSWASINFIGSSVTVLFGAWTGTLLMSTKSAAEKLKILSVVMAVSFVTGLLLATFNPVIHKAWTASFTICHTGFLLAAVVAFVWLFDYRGYRRPAFPLVVVGMNSIFMYMLMGMLQSWIDQSLGIFTGRFEFAGALAPVFQACAVLLVMWYACYWLYQRRIFLKV